MSINIGSAYQPRIGAGEAQLVPENKSLAVYLRNQQQQIAQQRYLYQQQHYQDQQRQARDKMLMSEDFTKPGTYQQENSLREIASVKDLTRKYGIANPNASALDIQNATAKKRDEVNARVARRNEIQPLIKNNQDIIKADKNKYDHQAIGILHDRTLYNYDEKTGRYGHKDVNDIDPEAVQAIMNHPSVINEHTAIVDAVAPIKNQLETTEYGKTINTGLGLVKEGTTNKVRFVNDKGEPGISDKLVNYVLEKNPHIEDKLFWRVAQDQVKSANGDPNNFDKVQEVYDNIRHTNDPSMLGQVYGKAKASLEELQQHTNTEKYVNLGKFGAGQKTQPTPEDYKQIDDDIHHIRNAFGESGKESVPTPRAEQAVGQLIGTKFGGYNVTGAKFIKLNQSEGFSAKYEGENKPVTMKGLIDIQHAVETYGLDSPEADQAVKDAPRMASAGPHAVELTISSGSSDPSVTGTALKTQTILLDPKDENIDAALFNLIRQQQGDKSKKMNYNGLRNFRNKNRPTQAAPAKVDPKDPLAILKP